ncbi:MAG: hypothetical protein KKB20_08445 [Proteobacteria bacterium]|nr:hypothetical protein [Pseudomonadota bacterium]
MSIFIRWFLIVALFYLIYRVLRGMIFAARPPVSGPTRPEPGRVDTERTEDLVRDPQCGVYFPRSEGLASMVDGQVLYFCSQGCRDRYLEIAGGRKQGGRA